MSDGEKICVICGESCAGQPRIKDPKGHYYHKACHEAALAKRRQAAQTPINPPPALAGIDDAPGGGDDGDVMSLLLDDVAPAPAVDAPPIAAGGCQSCGAAMAPGAVVCMQCGYNAQTGGALKTKLKKDRSPSTSAVSSNLLSPTVVGLGALGVMGVLFVIGTQSEVGAMGFFAVDFLFSVVVYIWAIVVGFRESIVHGIGALCCGLWAIYVVYALNDNMYLRWLFGVYLLAILGNVALQVQYADMLGDYRYGY